MSVAKFLRFGHWQRRLNKISVSSRETTFGIFEDGITQFFQPYTVQDGTCAWSEF